MIFFFEIFFYKGYVYVVDLYFVVFFWDRVVFLVVKEFFVDVYGSFGGEGEEMGWDGVGDDGVG